MGVSWKDWAERRDDLDVSVAVEGLLALGQAYRSAEAEILIPLQTRIRALPEIIGMVRLAEQGGQEEAIGRLMSLAPRDLRDAFLHIREALLPEPFTPPLAGPFGFYVNLDERGEFYADVRDMTGKTIFEIRSDEDDGTIWLVEDGYMSHKEDLEGLGAYMKEMGMIRASSEILTSDRFESHLDSDQHDIQP